MRPADTSKRAQTTGPVGEGSILRFPAGSDRTHRNKTPSTKEPLEDA